MVKLVVLYGRPEDPDTFERYYAETIANFATGGVTIFIAEIDD
jgi:hypothetical protein